MWNFILGPFLLQENLQKTNYQFRSVRSIKIDGVLSYRIRSEIVFLGCIWTVYARLFYLNTRPEKYFTLFCNYIVFSTNIFNTFYNTNVVCNLWCYIKIIVVRPQPYSFINYGSASWLSLHQKSVLQVCITNLSISFRVPLLVFN